MQLMKDNLLIGMITLLVIGGFTQSCSVFKTKKSPEKDTSQVQKKPEKQQPPQPPYHSSQKRDMDLIHTELDVQPVWQNQQLNGKATLTLSPYFYPQDSLILDAKGFKIQQIKLLKNDTALALAYSYDSELIDIQLDRRYHRKDTLKLKINYTANPTDLNKSGGNNIGGAQGLYFIDPDSTNPEKPTQMWTQGEPEASSAWFPTIDQPNEKTTQEIYITVKKEFKTLSNGQRVYSILNDDGTRTDYWRMNKPHAPYLFMMAVGDFAVVEDEWRDSIPVDYYVEPEYEEHANMIFDVTPEMMEFYSNLLDYDYPWSKYAQVAVRNFVAGAMENTTSTIHFSGIQQTPKEYIDKTYESLIAHELIHHWFGNVVTCESWSNLALNESFATYGEYLWKEHQHGRAAAGQKWLEDYGDYLNEAQNIKKPLIQHRYHAVEQLFDDHRYEKGSCILHMLRHYLGDDAFFSGLNHYLNQREFKPAEYQHLRLALEEVSGKDLRWFFEQWFEEPGHPKLEIHQSYNPRSGEVKLKVEQTQNTSKYPVYQLPVTIDVYPSEDQKPKSHEITIDQVSDSFNLKVSQNPALVNFDAKKVLLAETNFNKTPKEWIFQYHNAPLFLDRYEALEGFNKLLTSPSKKPINATISKFYSEVLGDPFWSMRKKGVQSIGNLKDSGLVVSFEEKLKSIASNDNHPDVRAAALAILKDTIFTTQVKVFNNAIQDPSYQVQLQALKGLYQHDSTSALEHASQFYKLDKSNFLHVVGQIYAKYGSKGVNGKLHKLIADKIDPGYRNSLINAYLEKYLPRYRPSYTLENMRLFDTLINETIQKEWQRLTLINILKQYKNSIQEKKKATKDSIESEQKEDQKAGDLQKELETYKEITDEIANKITKLKKN